MKKDRPTAALLLLLLAMIACQRVPYNHVTIVQTSKSGDKLKEVGKEKFETIATSVHPRVMLDPYATYQQILGFGGAFTESAAFVLNQLSEPKRAEVLQKYFSRACAGYSLMRTHINSCDFSLSNYSYAPVPNDTNLTHFSIDEDLDDLLPLIRDARNVPGAEFKIIASPWTAPIWMKDNQQWNNGLLKKEWQPTWALFFSKYIREYVKRGVPIWGVTVQNEPLGNGGQWESMIFSPGTMAEFIRDHLGPQFVRDNLDVKIFAYDQNRDDVAAWADTILADSLAAEYVWGTAVHWYSSTVDWYPAALKSVHEKFPDKTLLHTEGCIDNIGNDEPQGIWLTDDWYWRAEATDWGYYWAADEDKKDHPRYAPVYRYARDIIGGMNSWLIGWIDWNIALDTKGGPNHAGNWCLAPVLVDAANDSVYYTPLFYTMSHFSKYIRPDSHRIRAETEAAELMVTACKNPDDSMVAVVLNQQNHPVTYHLVIESCMAEITIPDNAIQTLLIK
ncbi:MAG: glycoside hydrolase family 30 protein [Candidatus Zhuqueibacterota bacterium]